MFMVHAMRFLVLVTAMTAAACCGAATPREALAAFNAALAAGDGAAASALLAPEVTIYESGYVERSRAEYASHHLQEDLAFASTARRTVLRHDERIDGALAVLWEETETTGSSQGKALHLFGTETAMLALRDGAWRIVHLHWSSRKAK
jgi:ketosteroid isomerase-like protein